MQGGVWPPGAEQLRGVALVVWYSSDSVVQVWHYQCDGTEDCGFWDLEEEQKGRMEYTTEDQVGEVVAW